jgi:hypothetical protein
MEDTNLSATLPTQSLMVSFESVPLAHMASIRKGLRWILDERLDKRPFFCFAEMAARESSVQATPISTHVKSLKENVASSTLPGCVIVTDKHFLGRMAVRDENAPSTLGLGHPSVEQRDLVEIMKILGVSDGITEQELVRLRRMAKGEANAEDLTVASAALTANRVLALLETSLSAFLVAQQSILRLNNKRARKAFSSIQKPLLAWEDQGAAAEEWKSKTSMVELTVDGRVQHTQLPLSVLLTSFLSSWTSQDKSRKHAAKMDAMKEGASQVSSGINPANPKRK